MKSPSELPMTLPGENDFVHLPEHEYVATHGQITTDAFRAFSEVAANTFHNNPSYPNARLHISPYPSEMRSGVLDFVVIWGEATSIPLPRQHMLPQYFGKIALQNRRRRKLHEVTVLDAHGFIGLVSTNSDNFPELSAITADERGIQKVANYGIATSEACDMAMVDILADIKVGQPLRFHQSIRWWEHSMYTGINFFDDDYTRQKSNAY